MGLQWQKQMVCIMPEMQDEWESDGMKKHKKQEYTGIIIALLTAVLTVAGLSFIGEYTNHKHKEHVPTILGSLHKNAEIYMQLKMEARE